MGGASALLLAIAVALLVWSGRLFWRTLGQPDSAWGETRRLGKLVFCWTLWVGCVALSTLLLRSFPSAEPVARRTMCCNNLKQIGLAMNVYHDVFGSFPPAYTVDAKGQRLQSWRVLLLPFMDEEHRQLYEQIKLHEPWNSPHNQLVGKTAPDVYHCPSDAYAVESETSYVLVVGPGTLFEGAERKRVEDVTDGPAVTIVVVEMARCEIHWMKPEDLSVEQMSFTVNEPVRRGLRSEHHRSVCVLVADGSVHVIPEDIAPELLSALMTRNGGESVEEFTEY